MNKEEIEDILEELHLVRPEMLNSKAKKLFEAIMSIADERDEYKQRIDEAIEYIEYCKTSKNDIFPIIEEAKMKEILKGENK